jgi:MFS family permease
VPPATLAEANALSAAAWANAAVFLALVPSFVAHLLDSHDLAVTGASAGLLLSAAAVQPAASRLTPHQARQGGLTLLVAGCLLLLAASLHPGLALVLVAVVVSGTGQGLMFGYSMSRASAIAEHRQGRTWAIFYTVTYLAEAVPTIGIGFLANHIGLIGAVRVFLVAAVASCAVLGCVLARRSRHLGHRQFSSSPHLRPGWKRSAKP